MGICKYKVVRDNELIRMEDRSTRVELKLCDTRLIRFQAAL